MAGIEPSFDTSAEVASKLLVHTSRSRRWVFTFPFGLQTAKLAQFGVRQRISKPERNKVRRVVPSPMGQYFLIDAQRDVFSQTLKAGRRV